MADMPVREEGPVPSLDSELQAVAALHRAGRFDEARAACRDLAARFPAEGEPPFREGLVEAEAGRLAEAREALGRALALRDRPHYRYAMGDVQERLGDRAGAIESWRRAVAAQPGLVAAHIRLGVALQETGELSQAVAHFVLAANARPGDARAWNNLAAALFAQGRSREAEVAARNALKIDPGHASAAMNLGRALAAQGKEAEAAPWLERALEREPSRAVAWDCLGFCRERTGSLLAARDAYSRAVAADPAMAGARVRLGEVCARLGLAEECVQAMRSAEALGPPDAAQVGSALLFALQYGAGHGKDEVFAAHRAWAARYAPPRPRPAFPNSRDPARRLRIGYLSPRFQASSAAFLSVPVIERHDRSAFEVHCYAEQDAEDAVTRRIRASGAKWTDTRGLDDGQLAARMREDGIDIAIDLAGHTPGNRLTMFAHGPAPVTASWLDYFNTTGMDQVANLLSDPIQSPPGDGQPFAERILRLPHVRFCWEPPGYAPDVVPPPLCRGGRAPVFGSFNRMAKLSPATLDAWCSVLREVPGSRLILKNSALGRDEEHAFFARWFAERGVDPARVEWRGPSGHEAMLAEYADIDIALDTFPYTGGLTTIEALWMGRPVVAVAGDTLIARQSKAILTAIGLPELCAPDAAAFVSVAKGLASDAGRLAALSAELRAQMRRSPLLDTTTFTRDLESLLRSEWRRWCAEG